MSVLPATSELGDIAAIVARTSLSYDLLPYASNPFPRTQLSFSRDGIPIDDPAQREAVATDNVKALFAAFARAALLRT